MLRPPPDRSTRPRPRRALRSTGGPICHARLAAAAAAEGSASAFVLLHVEDSTDKRNRQVDARRQLVIVGPHCETPRKQTELRPSTDARKTAR